MQERTITAGKCLENYVTHSGTLGLLLSAASPDHSHTVKTPLTAQRRMGLDRNGCRRIGNIAIFSLLS